MIQLRTVNNALKSKYPSGIELVAGPGYFYFIGDLVDRAWTTSVMVYRLNQLTLAQWLDEAETVIANAKDRSCK